MKVITQITQEEFDNFPVIDGYKQCPLGDYTQIKYFGKCCTFDDNCILGNHNSGKEERM